MTNKNNDFLLSNGNISLFYVLIIQCTKKVVTKLHLKYFSIIHSFNDDIINILMNFKHDVYVLLVNYQDFIVSLGILCLSIANIYIQLA